MEELKRITKTLKSYIPHGISVKEFIMTEMMLELFKRYAPENDVNSAYILLHNYALIGNISDTAEASFLQKARVYLRACSSKENWKRLLDQYKDSSLDNIRYYILRTKTKDEKEILTLEANPNSTPAPDRIDVYMEYIRQFRETYRTSFAKAGTYMYPIKSSVEPWVEVNIPSITPDMPEPLIQKNEREKITVKISQLESAAQEMRLILAEDYCADTLKNNEIKTVVDSKVMSAKELTLQEVVNLVGMVGSGKSTLMKVLTYHLSKQGKKIVLVLDTVSDVLNMYYYFRKLQLSVSPLIGKNERMKYIGQVMESRAKYLKPEFSEYLTAPCLLAGMAKSSESAPHFGEEACTNLKKDKMNYTCPFINVCPALKMYRDAYTSDVVVTTVAGLAAVRLPTENRLFLEHVLQQADLVIFDECDKVQKTLDEFFTPATEFMEFINNIAEPSSEVMKQNQERLDNIEQNKKNYILRRLQALPMSERVRQSIKAIEGSWKDLLSSTFSAATLYKRLKEDSENGKHSIAQNVLNQLKTVMREPDDDQLDAILECAKEQGNDYKFTEKLKKWLRENGCQADTELLQHIKLYFVVISFDNYMRSLESAYSFLTEEEKTEMELFNFLQARFTAQQKLLPSAVMGNLFGMKNDSKKGLQLYRQYAFGRALMNRLPWLRLTENGKAAGPHVLLLSGSSWAEGCLEYHVNVPVKYLLEGDQRIREKLAKATFVDLNTQIRVSGSREDIREQKLKELILKIMDFVNGELAGDGKQLMIVNSYHEAKIAASFLNSQLRNRSERAACMIRTSDDNNDIPQEYQVIRGEVAAFHEHSAKILVAPAQAIERGYNIVDNKGHSTFGSVFFLVRPMAVPDEISSKCTKLNGIIEQRFCNETFPNVYTKSKEVRRYARHKWREMEMQSKMALGHLNKTMKTDITAGLFVLILQIFGRLARITDLKKPAPTVYFADGAFRVSQKNPGGYDCLNAMIEYLENMMNNKESCEIAKTLYQPFYEALKNL